MDPTWLYQFVVAAAVIIVLAIFVSASLVSLLDL